MPDDLTNKLIEEASKQIPAKEVYGDLFSPAAKVVGQIAEDLLKTVQIPLLPLQAAAAFQDRVRRFIDRVIRGVPPDLIISPATQILGPAIEGIRYEEEDSLVAEMFAHLLSSAINKNRVSKAHPSFPALIGQLSRDEALLLASLATSSYSRERLMDYDVNERLFSNDRTVRDTLPSADLLYPENTALYIEHLTHLGLAGCFQVGNQEPLWSDEPYRKQTGVRITEEYRLTPWGRLFADACLGRENTTA